MKSALKNFIIAGASAALLSGCIDSKYDLDNIDGEMTILPGISVPVDYSTKPSDLGALIGGEETKKDASGNYIVEGTSSKELTSTVSSSKFEEAQPIAIEGNIEIAFNNIPSYLQNLKKDTPLKAPKIELSIANPTGSEVTFKCRISNGKEFVDIDDIAVSPSSGNQKVTIDDSRLDNLFIGQVPSRIIISDMTVQKKQSVTKALTSAPVLTASNFTFNIGAMCTLPITLKPGGGIIIKYELLLEEKDLKMFTDANANMTNFSAEGTVTSTFPLTISPEFLGTNAAGTSVGSATLAYKFNDETVSAVQSGTEAAPATTSVKANVSLTDNIGNVRKLSITLNADNNSSQNVTLNDSQTLTFYVKSITADGGITISL